MLENSGAKMLPIVNYVFKIKATGPGLVYSWDLGVEVREGDRVFYVFIKNEPDYTS